MKKTTTAILIALSLFAIIQWGRGWTEKMQAENNHSKAELVTAQAAADVMRWRQQEEERQNLHDRRKDWFLIGGSWLMVGVLFWRLEQKSRHSDKRLIDVIDWVVRRDGQNPK